MSFPINVNVPSTNNDPADDQPIMKQNFANISGYLSVDHVPAGTTGNGYHEQVTYWTENVPGTPIDPVSVGYTDVGVADPTHPQHFWINSQGKFPLSGVRAFGRFTAAGATAPPTSGYNINGDVVNTGTSYAITLNAGTVFGNNPTVIVTASNQAVTYSFTGGVLTIVTANLGSVINFVILQI